MPDCQSFMIYDANNKITETNYTGFINCLSTNHQLNSNQIRTYLTNQIIPDYMNSTMQIISLNNAHVSTNYLKNDLIQKNVESIAMNKKAINNVEKVRYSYLQKKRTSAYYKFMSGIIQSLIIIIAISSILFIFYKNKKLSPMLLGAAISIIMAMFLIVVAILIKNNMTRRQDDWGKFYFAPNNPSS